MQRGIYRQSIALASFLFLGLASEFSAAIHIAPAIAGHWCLTRAADARNEPRALLVQTTGAPSLLLIEQNMPLSTLNSQVTPQEYGAMGDGVTDDTAAFQAALEAGDLSVPPAIYLINGSVKVPSHRNVRCKRGANLRTTRHDGNESGVITFSGVRDSSLIGCTITGSNTATVPVLDGKQWNYLIWIRGSSYDIVLTRNTLKNSWANSALHIDGNEGSPNIPSTDILVTYNDFESNGYYGLATISANHVQALHNRFVDSSCCAEANSPATDQSKYNVYAYNYMTSVNGNAATCTDCESGIFLTGGESPNNFNYGTVQVHDNYVTGKNTRLITSANPGSTPPVYADNRCLNGCREQ